MRKIILCVLAVMLWSQAVDTLECYYCVTETNCVVKTCPAGQDQCMTMIGKSGIAMTSYGSNCGTLAICEAYNKMSRVTATCCDTDRCNRRPSQ